MSNILYIYYGVLSLKIIEFFLEFQEMASLVHWYIYIYSFFNPFNQFMMMLKNGQTYFKNLALNIKNCIKNF